MGGCASSKILLEGDERISQGLKPLQKKIEDAKKRRRQRYSIISTTELLSQEAVDSSNSSSRKVNPSAIVPEPIPEEDEFKNDGKLQNLREEMPGSPSFRFYCTDNLPPNRSFDSNDSFKLSASFKRSENVKETDEKIQDGKSIVKSDEKIQDGKPIVKSVEKIQYSKPIVKSVEKIHDVKPTVKLQDSNEGSEGKSTKKGRKLLTLPKPPNAVQNLFTCYTSTHSAASNQQKK